MKPIFRIALASLVVLGLALLASPRPASAHPMGNFTINRYSALTVGEDRVDLLYVVDMAEIPAYQELGTIRPDHSTDLTAAERDGYTSRKATELLPGLTLSMNGAPVALTVLGKPNLSFPPGTGGLPTLRLEFSLAAPLQAQRQGAQKGTLAYQDSNFPDRIGWKEIIARPAPGVTLDKSTVPTTDLSNALRKYPVDLLSNPPLVTSASLDFALGGPPPASTGATTQAQAPQQGADAWGSLAWVRQQTDAITAILHQKDLPLGALLAALLIAFGVGAAHALSPGHGKTVVAAYLVGSRGTALHAIMLGLTVTLSHTIGVFMLGFVVLYLANYMLPETLYPWLSFLSGTLLVVMGLSLFVQRWRTWKKQKVADSYPHVHDGHTHTHTHSPASHAHEVQTQVLSEHEDQDHREHAHGEDHEHTHEHGHNRVSPRDDPSALHTYGPFGRPHTHMPTDAQKVTLGNLLVLGIMGGIIPCPSALVVLLVAVASGQVALGMLLILAFSIGLAAVLMGIGLLMVYSRNMLNRFNFGGQRIAWVLGRLPMFSALAVSGLGVLIAFGAFNIK